MPGFPCLSRHQYLILESSHPQELVLQVITCLATDLLFESAECDIVAIVNSFLLCEETACDGLND